MNSPSPTPTGRLPWIDHVRTVCIFLVVLTHACVTYSHIGSWYVMAERDPTLNEKIPFIVIESLNQSFFMGLLFFLAAYFAQKSLARKGAGAFVRERLFRLGLPTLLFMLVIHPFIVVGLHPWPDYHPALLPWYAEYVASGRFVGSTGPLWFAFALLIFSLLFVVVRSVFPPPTAAPAPTTANAPGAGAIWLFAVLLGLATGLVRLVAPLGSSVINMQLCFFPQYVAAFYLGVQAARREWLGALAGSQQAARAGLVTIIVSPVVLVIILIAGIRGGPKVFDGGLHWQAFALALWEQVTGVGLSLGLLALVSRKLNRDTPVLRWLADRAFGVYVLHTPVIIALYLAYRALPDIPLMLALLLWVTGLVVSFALADLAKRTPGLRAIL